MYAIIEACGKQYKVAEGDEVFVEKLNLNEKTEEDSGTISAKFVKDDKKSEQTNAEVATSTENTNAN